MKKYKNLIEILLVIIVIIFGIFYLSKLGENKYFKEINYEKYTNLLKEDQAFVYVGSRENKAAWNDVENFAKSNGIKFNYIYTENLTDSQVNEILGKNDTTIIYVTEDEVDKYNSEITDTNIVSYFTEKGLLARTFVKIGINDYLDLIQKENSIIVIGRTGCSYCEKFQPIINEVMEENNVVIYYFDIYSLTEEEYTLLSNSADFFGTEWGTPSTLVFNKGKVVDVQSGYSDVATFTKFLKDAGAIK